MHHPTDRITHTTAFVTPVVEHWLEWEIVQWVHPMKDQSNDPLHHERTLLPWSYISLPMSREGGTVSQFCSFRNYITSVALWHAALSWRKEMFYLTTHSTHFIYGYMASNMVEDHSDSERGNLLLFFISSKGSFICNRITHTMAFVTPVVEHWLEREHYHEESWVWLPLNLVTFWQVC